MRTTDPVAVNQEVDRIFLGLYSEASTGPLDQAFSDVTRLFSGEYPGYRACDTAYHDIQHTLDVTLATARLIDGHDRTQPGAGQLGARRAVLGVVIALLHDSGYMRRKSESGVENGAVFTKIHVSRSADFLARYLPTIGFAAETQDLLANAAALLSRVVRSVGERLGAIRERYRCFDAFVADPPGVALVAGAGGDHGILGDVGAVRPAEEIACE